MHEFLNFLTMIYQGNNGGIGLFLAFCVTAAVFGEIVVSIVKCFRRK